MHILSRYLGVKVLVLVSLLTILAFTGLFLANSSWQRHATFDQITASAVRTSDLLQMAIAEPMSLGNNEATMAQFSALAAHYKDIRVSLTDFKGNVTYSTDPAALRRDLAATAGSATVSAMLAGRLASAGESHDLLDIGGTPHVVGVRSVPNEPACHHCHGASKPILGAMVILQDVSAQVATLHREQVQGALLSLAGLVLLLSALLFFMKRSIINRINIISASSEAIAQGALNVDFTVHGQDELARLGGHLTHMVGRIKDQLEYNKSVLSGINMPMFVADGEEKIQFINRPLLAILGRTEQEAAGSAVSMTFYGESRDTATTQVLASGECLRGTVELARTDGTVFPLRYEISPLKDGQGRTVGVIGVFVDMTQEERDRAAIEAQRQDLLMVATEVSQAAGALSAAASELTAQMADLTQGVDKTADQTSQVATAMEEMNSTVLEVSRSAGQTAEISEQASQVAAAGGAGVKDTVTETRLVAETTENLSRALTELSDRAANIGQVMSVINDIADQTNLLALNAAIEAARAGDARRGVAGVADEVRKLAEKTMTATKEVDAAVHEIQASTQDAVREMEGTRERVKRSTGLADNAGHVLEEIVKQSLTIADMVRTIATAAEQQSATSEEINMNLGRINNLSQDISQRIQAASLSIREVSAMAGKLDTLVERFRA
jgi:methyl-accepting chemotaxis protein